VLGRAEDLVVLVTLAGNDHGVLSGSLVDGLVDRGSAIDFNKDLFIQ